MACNTLLTADILNSCTTLPVKGLKAKAWAFNRSEVTLTITDNKVTAIAKATGKTSFTVEGFKDFMNAGHEAVIAEDKPTSYKHKWTLNTYAATSAEKKNIDKADDLIVIVERNGAKNETSFIVLGANNGIWKTAQSAMANDNSGVSAIEFATRDDQGEEYSEYVFWSSTYATTLAALVATETV